MTLHLQQLGLGVDSAIYASVARNVWENRTWLNPTYTEFYHTPFAEHPPLMFWLQALVFGLFGATDATARLVSIVAGIGSVALTYSIGRRIVDERFGFLAAMTLMLTVNYLSLCFKTFIEPLFFFCLLLSLFGLVRASAENSFSGWLLFGVGLGASFLAKGIVVAGYLLGLGIWILSSKPDLLRKVNFWIGLAIAFIIPATYLILEATFGKNYFSSYYFGQQIAARALHSGGRNYINYTRHLFNLYWPWLPFLFPGVYYAFKRKNLWLRLFALILLSYAAFHSLATRLSWQYYANVYVFGAFISAFAWHQFPRLQFNLERCKQYFLPILMLLFVVAQALPIRMHEMKDAKLLSMTPYAEKIFQAQPRRVLFTEKSFGPWSIPAKMKWYWRVDAKYVRTPEELLQEYVKDGRFAFVIVDESELATFLATAAKFDFQPLLKSGNVIMVVQRDRLPAHAEFFDVKLPQDFFR
ncbi:MAG: glycosyltransferase family 39 protein [candidate division KSB1 bacterium]|nr:glycosyltransferase family 39 protein [candidate division KSB1 bacterium]MDZ7404114.1 glycosyltransferase family 39 protein [candidate division KSB1 bacterium]